MVRSDRCCVGTCDNDTRYPEKQIIKYHVTKLMFHRFPCNEQKRKTWISLVGKGRDSYVPTDGSRICSNHFPEGRPTIKHPNPTLWLTIQDNRQNKVITVRKSPCKKRLYPFGKQVMNYHHYQVKYQISPYDTVMADRGFKIKSDLTMHRCYLAIAPSAASGTQMTKDDVLETNRIANVRIFVEKAIARIKWFRILKVEMSLLEMPLIDDI